MMMMMMNIIIVPYMISSSSSHTLNFDNQNVNKKDLNFFFVSYILHITTNTIRM